MQVFEQGHYCGHIEQSLTDEWTLASVTRYRHDAFNSALYYHENAHISFVLSGGCLKTKKSAYERSPGTIIFYHAGRFTMSQVDDRSKYINLEIKPHFFKKYDLDPTGVATAIGSNLDMKFLMLKLYRELLADDELSSLPYGPGGQGISMALKDTEALCEIILSGDISEEKKTAFQKIRSEEAKSLAKVQKQGISLKNKSLLVGASFLGLS